VRSGVDVAKIELIDELSATMANDYIGSDLPDAPMTFLEFHANHGVEEEIAFCRSVFEEHGVERFEMADEEEMEGLWAARRELAFATRAWDPDRQPLHPGDITVPISEYPDIIRYAKRLEAEYDLPVPCFGHAGDGNLHYTVLVADDPAERERGEELYRDIVERAIEVGGTCTGEHGIGMGKREYMDLEHGAASVEAMRRVKRAFDPNDTLNPGKLFPETAEGGRVRAEADDD
jgi:D-lactate dehydrogenase (cytochrome)